MKHQLTINPKFNGSTIKFGKLPLLTRSLTALASMDDVAQLVVEGRYYAVEIKGKDAEATSTADETVESLLKAIAKKDGFVSARVEKKPAREEQPKEKPKKAQPKKKTLSDLGFVDLQSADNNKPKTPPRVPVKKESVKRGNLSLFDWLKVQDYVVEKLFVSSTGQPLMNKIVDVDDVRLAIMEAGVEDTRKGASERGSNAARLSNIAVALLIRAGVLDAGFDTENFGGKRVYQLSIDKGGNYARKVHQTVSRGEYPIDPKTGRRDVLAG